MMVLCLVMAIPAIVLDPWFPPAGRLAPQLLKRSATDSAKEFGFCPKKMALQNNTNARVDAVAAANWKECSTKVPRECDSHG